MDRPMYTNLVNGTVGICRTEGFSGIYRGLWPTVCESTRREQGWLTHQIMKQGANSAVRFSSYAYLQQLALAYSKPVSGKLSGTTTFGLGAVAGLITVCEFGRARRAWLRSVTDSIRHHHAARQH